MTKLIRASRDKVSLKIERGGRIILVDVPLRISEVGDKFGKKKNVATIGIEPSSKIRIVKYNLFESFIKGFQTLIELTGIIVQGFASMIFGIIPIKEAVTGPLGIYYITAEAVKVGMAAILHLMAVLSVSLSIINLIPLPLFDGGHILVFLIERFRKKHLSKTAEEYLTRLGFVIIAVIVLFVFYNDVVRFGSKIWGK
jgi:regulator of sigma E protease